MAVEQKKKYTLTVEFSGYGGSVVKVDAATFKNSADLAYIYVFPDDSVPTRKQLADWIKSDLRIIEAPLNLNAANERDRNFLQTRLQIQMAKYAAEFGLIKTATADL